MKTVLPWCRIGGGNGFHSIKRNNMSFQTFLEPSHLLETLVLALSIFNLVTFLWLAVTVWLNGDRSTWIARLGVVGLGFSALFFFIHALLIFSSLNLPSGLVTQDFLWRLLWLPAIAVPYIWFAIGLHYAALINKGWRRRRPMLLICSGLLGGFLLVMLILYQTTFTFVGTLRLLAYGNLFDDKAAGLFSPVVFLPVLFLFYVAFCAIGPWFTPGRVHRVMQALVNFIIKRSGHSQLKVHNDKLGALHEAPTLYRTLSNAFWDDPTDVELLQEPILSWHLARPGLFFAAILMVGLTITLGILGIWSIADWFVLQQHPSSPLPISLPLKGIPLNLLVLDMLATGAVALIILLVGYSIVRHGVLIERPLARRGFLEQWRGIVIVATAVAIFIALLVDFEFPHSNLGSLLLITSLATCAYALFTWSSYTAHDRYIALLGPFLRSTSLRHWLNTDLRKTEQELEDLFFHLCQDILAVQCSRLVIIAGSVRRSFRYRWPEGAWDAVRGTVYGETQRVLERRAIGVNAHRVQMTLHGQQMICWVFPIYDERGLVATLYLGPRQDGGAFTDEDMDLAHACGQRILDTLGDHEAMQAVAGLLRHRIVDVKLLGAQQRRVLHDEILPQMHLALLRLEALRSFIHEHHSTSLECQQQDGDSLSPEQVLNEAVDEITDAHRRLATMMM